MGAGEWNPGFCIRRTLLPLWFVLEIWGHLGTFLGIQLFQGLEPLPNTWLIEGRNSEVTQCISNMRGVPQRSTITDGIFFENVKAEAFRLEVSENST